MSDAERRSIELGLRILDQELVAAGEEPLVVHPYVREAEPFLGVFPVFRLEKAGSAPFAFLFGRTLEVSLGPYSEIVHADAGPGDEAYIRQAVHRLLRSSVSVTHKRWRTRVELTLPGQAQAWSRHTYGGVGKDSALTGHFRPFIG